MKALVDAFSGTLNRAKVVTGENRPADNGSKDELFCVQWCHLHVPRLVSLRTTVLIVSKSLSAFCSGRALGRWLGRPDTVVDSELLRRCAIRKF